MLISKHATSSSLHTGSALAGRAATSTLVILQCSKQLRSPVHSASSSFQRLSQLYGPQTSLVSCNRSFACISRAPSKPSVPVRWRRRRRTDLLAFPGIPSHGIRYSQYATDRLKTPAQGANRRYLSRVRFVEALEEYHAALQAQADHAPADSAIVSKVQWVADLKRYYGSDASPATCNETREDEADDDQENDGREGHDGHDEDHIRSEPSSPSQTTEFASVSASTVSATAEGEAAPAAASAVRHSSAIWTWRNTWDFAHQKLVFPVDMDWPPPLPGLPGDEVVGRGSQSGLPMGSVSLAFLNNSLSQSGSALYPSPRLNCAPTLPPSPSLSARDLAALALDVHRFSARPKSQIVRKGIHKAPAAPVGKWLRQKLREVEGSDDSYHLAWRCGWKAEEPRAPVPTFSSAAEPEERDLLFWLAERNQRLEFLGDALAREISSRIAYDTFPDLNPGGISMISSHLSTNDTFGFLYSLSGMDRLRAELAGELLKEAVEKEKATSGFQWPEGITSEIFDVGVEDLDQSGKADRFEAYLAYIRLVHGPLVADYWFSSLLRPWVNRLASDPQLYTVRNVSPAGQLRRRVEQKQKEEALQQEELGRYRNSRWGFLAVAGRGLLRRLLGREEKGREAERGENTGRK